MRRVLHLKMVTQCAMLEDFGIFLVLADKSLFAYHIEALVPSSPQSAHTSQTPQKLNGTKDVHFFSVGSLGGRTLVIYMKKKGVCYRSHCSLISIWRRILLAWQRLPCSRACHWQDQREDKSTSLIELPSGYSLAEIRVVQSLQGESADLLNRLSYINTPERISSCHLNLSIWFSWKLRSPSYVRKALRSWTWPSKWLGNWCCCSRWCIISAVSRV